MSRLTPRFTSTLTHLAMLAVLLCSAATSAPAQKHSAGSAPPTAPVLPPPAPARLAPQPAPIVRQPPSAASPHAAVSAPIPSGPIAPVSTGLGAIQFLSANVGTPAPQSLIRQLSSEDERARIGALSSIGAPGQYLLHGHVPIPHSMQLDLLQLGTTDELDAVLTVELDDHVVSAILSPDGLGWRRLATLSFASSFNAGATTPSNFLHPLRSWLQPGRYRAVYHATVSNPNGDFTENEADVRILNGHAAVVVSFVSGARQCDTTGQLRPAHQSCEILQRWLEPDPTDPTHHFTLVTGIGHIPIHEAADPLTQSRNYRLTRLRSFACQPFAFAENGQKLEPLANSAPCVAHEPSSPHPEHSGAPEHGAGTSAPASAHAAVAEHPVTAQNAPQR